MTMSMLIRKTVDRKTQGTHTAKESRKDHTCPIIAMSILIRSTVDRKTQVTYTARVREGVAV